MTPGRRPRRRCSAVSSLRRRGRCRGPGQPPPRSTTCRPPSTARATPAPSTSPSPRRPTRRATARWRACSGPPRAPRRSTPTNHAVVIKSSAACRRPTSRRPRSRRTKENLQAAIAGESYERDTMYPEFLAQARKDGNKDAARDLQLRQDRRGRARQDVHRRAQDLDALKGRKATTYYVCTVCGYTTTNLDFQKCPVVLQPQGQVHRRHLTDPGHRARPPASGRPRLFARRP